MIEALVSFQATFDYADTLAEHKADDPQANARALHQALLDSLLSQRDRPDYYAHSSSNGDGGYLDHLVNQCRKAFTALPSHGVVERPLGRAVRRMIDYQTLIHGDGALAPISLAAWARDETPAGSGLRWWETAAAGASSLVAFALIAAAARPDLSGRDVRAIERAYFPWYGSLHVLLDSLVDLPRDILSGHHSLVQHYDSPEQAAARMEAIGTAAVRSAERLPNPNQHALFLAAMAGFYLAKPAARLPHAAETTERLSGILGDVARPVLSSTGPEVASGDGQIGVSNGARSAICGARPRGLALLDRRLPLRPTRVAVVATACRADPGSEPASYRVRHRAPRAWEL